MASVFTQWISDYTCDLLSRRTLAAYHNLVESNWTWRINDTLESVAHAYAGGANVTFEYRYNTENGVRARLVSDATYQAGAGNPALAVGTRGYTANALNQYTAVAGTSLSYDNDGNLSGDGTWTYGHDAQGRLVSAAKAGTTIGYGYDAAGRRRSRTVNGVTVTSLWSGDQEVAEYNAAGALVRRFVWGPMGVDEILAIIGVVGGPAARRRFQHADGLGSVVAATTGNGSLEAKFAYTPYGVADGNAGPPWRFTGRRLDPDTGLYYLRARDYSPLLGRFIQPDPIGMAGGINLYAYVGNDPLNATDLRGRSADRLSGTPNPLFQLINAQSTFHDVIREQLASDLRARGAIVETEVRMQGYAPDPRTGLPAPVRVDILAMVPPPAHR